ncbi:F-box/LRR-repeat protein 5-like isoform X2 [Asterias rubens]|uniref:F-box/LRR-repeat protein 5-like isoform X2 n=1 Tax=Asterias rubens TaxID=7604 RepID=UPI001454EE8D|nr:F-box/LRR-repeat protein 5-like isoform X2 [Asterias rubens]
MAPAPSEVDVFSGPHSRMKELVRIYSNKLTVTDFSNYADLRELLWSLRSTFREFQTHECIENECIMQKLKHRLDFLKVENQAVYKVHSDNRLSDMQGLLEDGCHRTEHLQSPSEMRTIGSQIKDALEVFTKNFLPHMQEEEEFFQPLLMQYFTYDELKEIRYNVIEKHSLHTKYNLEQDKESSHENTSEKVDGLKEDVEDKVTCRVSGLPSETLLQIFSYLNPKDLSHCAQVSSHWNEMALDGSLWKNLYPVRWAQGDWSFYFDESDAELQDIPPEDDEEDIYVTKDEDADFDESEASADSDEKNNHAVNQSVTSIRRETKMLEGIAKYLIPVVGHGVERLNLSQSRGLNNAAVYRLLANTPNLKHLDLSLTKVSDIAFKGFGKNGSGRQLKYLNLAGSTSISDSTLRRLAAAIAPPMEKQQPKCDNTKRSNEISCTGSECNSHCRGMNASDELPTDKNGRPMVRCHKHTVNGSEIANPTSTVTRLSSTRERINVILNDADVTQRDADVTQRDADVIRHDMTQCDADVTSYRTEGGLSNDRGAIVAPRTCSSNTHSIKDTIIINQEGNDTEGRSQLEFLSLAGCYKITDNGLRLLATNGGLPHLKHLDLSGCLNVTSAGLNQLATVCHGIVQEEFFYCDNILEGPYPDTASGCQNLQCSNLVCCRSGE